MLAQRLSEESKAIIVENEKELVQLADSMLRSPIPDDRPDFGFRFAKLLKVTLDIEGSAQYPFDSLSQKIHIIQPEDKSFRIFNWLVQPGNFMIRYYGIIQRKDGKLFPLLNYSDRIEVDQAQNASLNINKWYGGEYYNIKDVTVGKQKYYVLFGWNRDGSYSYKKFLDVLYFADDDAWFGAPLFNIPSADGRRMQKLSRVIWEYKPGSSFSLNYDPQLKMITFDRMRSEINNPLRKNSYVPTGQTDGLKWEKNQWVFVNEAIPILHLEDGGAPIDGVLK